MWSNLACQVRCWSVLLVVMWLWIIYEMVELFWSMHKFISTNTAQSIRILICYQNYFWQQYCFPQWCHFKYFADMNINIFRKPTVAPHTGFKDANYEKKIIIIIIIIKCSWTLCFFQILNKALFKVIEKHMPWVYKSR